MVQLASLNLVSRVVQSYRGISPDHCIAEHAEGSAVLHSEPSQRPVLRIWRGGGFRKTLSVIQYTVESKVVGENCTVNFWFLFIWSRSTCKHNEEGLFVCTSPPPPPILASLYSIQRQLFRVRTKGLWKEEQGGKGPSVFAVF